LKGVDASHVEPTLKYHPDNFEGSNSGRVIPVEDKVGYGGSLTGAGPRSQRVTEEYEGAAPATDRKSSL